MLEGTAPTPKPGEVREAPTTKQFPMSDGVDDLSWLDDSNADFDFVDGQLVLKGKPENVSQDGNAPSPKPTEGEVKPSEQQTQVAQPSNEVAELREQLRQVQQGMITLLQRQNGQQPIQPVESEPEIDWTDSIQVKTYYQNEVKKQVAEALKPYQQGIQAASVNNELIAVQQKYNLTQDNLKQFAPVMSKILEGVPEMSIEKAYLIAKDVVQLQPTKTQESTLESTKPQPKPAGDLIKRISNLTSEADQGRRATSGRDPNHLPSVDEAFEDAIATLVGRG